LRDKDKVKGVVRVLIGSKFYFTLSLQERYDLIRDILRKFPTVRRADVFGGEK
jgi:hypothetical protein